MKDDGRAKDPLADLKSLCEEKSLQLRDFDKVPEIKSLRACDNASERIRRDHLRNHRRLKKDGEALRGINTVREQLPRKAEYALRKGFVGNVRELAVYLERYVKSRCPKILSDSIQREAKKKFIANRNADTGSEN